MALDNPSARRAVLGVALAVLVAGVMAIPLTRGSDRSLTGEEVASKSSTSTTDAGDDGGNDGGGPGGSGGDGTTDGSGPDGTGPGGSGTKGPGGDAGTGSGTGTQGSGSSSGGSVQNPDGGAGIPATTSTSAVKRPPTGPGTTSTSRPSSGAQPGDPPAMTATAAGSYPYSIRQTSPGNPGSTSDFRLEVKAVAGGEGKQDHTEVYQSKRLAYRMAWRGDGLFEDAFTASVGDDSLACDWTGDFLTLAFPLQKDLRWTSEGTCSKDDGTKTSEYHRRDQARVLGGERLTVGGQQVDCWVIERTQVVTNTVRRTDGSSSSEQVEHTVKQWWAPKQGLLAKEDRTYAKSGQPGATYTEVRELRSLTAQ